MEGFDIKIGGKSVSVFCALLPERISQFYAVLFLEGFKLFVFPVGLKCFFKLVYDV